MTGYTPKTKHYAFDCRGAKPNKLGIRLYGLIPIPAIETRGAIIRIGRWRWKNGGVYVDEKILRICGKWIIKR